MTIPTKPQTSAINLGGGPVKTSRPQNRRPNAAKPHENLNRVDFKLVSKAALRELRPLLARWLPEGKFKGQEFVARNPRRTDHGLGSFKVNVRTGRWADFATGDCGGDPVSLAAFLFGLSQVEAARKLALMLGLPGGAA